ncbi:MAG: hypothetical protein M9947_07950 [Thermomicrobiales bacterium]|nr:hypothetical protein [Thermomicrobiales bacterium]
MLTRRTLLTSALAASALTLLTQSTQAQTPNPSGPIDPTLRDYLGMIPTSVASLDQGVPVLMGNAQLQADALDIPLPVDTDDEERVHTWQLGMGNVPIPEILRRTEQIYFGMQQVTGYQLSQIYSGVETGDPANMVTLVRGDLDPVVIQAAQEDVGYQRQEIDGHPIFALDQDREMESVGTLDLVSGRLACSTFLDDGTLVYAPTLDLIESLLAPESTLLDLPAVTQAIDTLDEPLISAALAGPGALLPYTPFEDEPPNNPETIANAWPDGSPLVQAAIIGSTAGGPLETFAGGATPVPAPNGVISRSKFTLVYPTAEEAVLAAGQIQHRLATGSSTSYEQPWSELFATWTVQPNEANTSVLVTIEWQNVPSKGLTLLYRRDLGFITG